MKTNKNKCKNNMNPEFNSKICFRKPKIIKGCETIDDYIAKIRDAVENKNFTDFFSYENFGIDLHVNDTIILPAFDLIVTEVEENPETKHTTKVKVKLPY